jgi:pimeloyl-ACP methyl ester carboxylesterase
MASEITRGSRGQGEFGEHPPQHTVVIPSAGILQADTIRGTGLEIGVPTGVQNTTDITVSAKNDIAKFPEQRALHRGVPSVQDMGANAPDLSSLTEPFHSFADQFREKQTMEVSGIKVPYTRLSPPTDKLTSGVPVVVAPGLTENHELLHRLLKQLYDDGRIVYTVSHPRVTIPVEPHGHPPAQEQKIATILGLMQAARNDNSTEGNKVDLLGRSDGGVNATFAAEQQPDWVDNLILLDTKHTAPTSEHKLAKNTLAFAASEAVDALVHPLQNTHLINVIKKAIAYVKDAPVKTAQEIEALAASDIRDILPSLREHGIGVFGIHGTADKEFNTAELQRDIALAGGRQQDPETLYFMGLASKRRDADGTTVYIKDRRITDTPQKLYDGFYTVKDRTHASVYKDKQYVRLVGHAVAAARARSEKLAQRPQLQLVHSEDAQSKTPDMSEREQLIAAGIPEGFLDHNQFNQLGITQDYNNEFYAIGFALERGNRDKLKMELGRTKTYEEFMKAKFEEHNQFAQQLAIPPIDPDDAYRVLVAEHQGAQSLDAITFQMRVLAESDVSFKEMEQSFGALKEQAYKYMYPRDEQDEQTAQAAE